MKTTMTLIMTMMMTMTMTTMTMILASRLVSRLKMNSRGCVYSSSRVHSAIYGIVQNMGIGYHASVRIMVKLDFSRAVSNTVQKTCNIMEPTIETKNGPQIAHLRAVSEVLKEYVCTYGHIHLRG